jgi:uncharacterized protein (DUF58 family)
VTTGSLRRRVFTVFPTMRVPTLVGVASVLWLIPGRVGTIAALAALGAVVVAIVVDFLRLPSRRSIAIETVAPDVVGLGDPAEVQYRVRSTWPTAARVELFDEFPSAIERDQAIRRGEVSANTGWSYDVPITGTTRGKFPLGAVALRVQTSLGLLARIIHPDVGGEVVVVPSIANVRRFRLLAMQHRLSDAGVRALKQRGEGNAFAGLREYSPGDDPRLVDWKATARHQHLITREQTVERSQTVICMIDSGRAMTQLAGRFSRFEHVLSATLLLSDVAASAGDRVGMIAFDDQVRAYVAPQRGAAALRSLRTTMSGLDATLTEPDYASAFRMLATRQRRRALIVFFTDVIESRAARAFIAYAGRAAQRHAVVIVAMQNEALLAAARPSTEGALALFRSAAAEELVHERAEALARMRKAGLTVLDVAPSKMAVAVVNRYLEVKARGSL